jgi:hypothetical protein
MKKFLFTLLSVFMFVSLNAQTTLSEYKYITKGYKSSVIDQGLDMKKGYSISALDTVVIGPRKVILNRLIKTTIEDTITVAHMAIYQRDNAEPDYICIPLKNSGNGILRLYWDNLVSQGSNSEEKLRIILFLSSMYLKE